MNTLLVRIVGIVSALVLSLAVGGKSDAQGLPAAPTAKSITTALVDPIYGIQLYNVNHSVNQNGVRTAQFNASLGIWGPWVNRGNQSGWPTQQWDPMLVGIGWTDFSRWPFLGRVNVFHEFTVNSTPPALWQGSVYRDASLTVPNPPYTWNYGIDFSPAPGMFPKSAFYQFPGALNVWGTDTAAHHPYIPLSAADIANYGRGATKLMERFWNSASWNGASHGNSEGANSRFPLLLGPQSSVWLGDTGMVVVAQDLGGGVNPEVTVNSYDRSSGRWGWAYLGSPGSRVEYLRAPLIVAYQRDDETRVRVFVVGLNNPTGIADRRRWELFSIERQSNGDWTDDRGVQGSWNSHGEAIGVEPTVGGRFAENNLAFGFDMTRAVVWSDGARTRVNIFGHTDNGDRMPEFWYDGATWRWGGTPHLAPAAGTMRLAGAVKVRRPDVNGIGNQYRVSAFVEIGNQIWERYYDTITTTGWAWQRRL